MPSWRRRAGGGRRGGKHRSGRAGAHRPGPDADVGTGEGRGTEFGLAYDFRDPARWARPAPRLYAELVEQIVYAERPGFDSVWLPEHHSVENGYTPSPLTLAAAIAARTTRLRVGTWVLLLPLHHPLRVAEDAATEDLLSKGRLDLGLGLGYRREELAAFGVDRRRRGA